MQTFVPYGREFHLTAQALDDKRLGKQRVEGLQILNVITGRSSGWKNHPAVKMWQGYPQALAIYTKMMCDEWVWNRGFQDTVKNTVDSIVDPKTYVGLQFPSWLDDDRVMLSHRSNLIRKSAFHYAWRWPNVSPDLPYFWPTNA